MNKVRLVCLDGDRRAVVSALHGAGILDLRRSKLELSDDNPAEHFIALSDLGIKLAGAIALLKRPKSLKKYRSTIHEKHMHAEQLISALSGMKVLDGIYSLDAEKKKLQHQLKQLEQSEAVARQLIGIDVNLDGLHSNVLAFKFYSVSNEKDMASFRDDLKKRKINAELLESGGNGARTALLAYEKGADIEGMVRRHSLKELDISANHLAGRPAEALDSILKEKARMQERAEAIAKELSRISDTEYRKLYALNEMLEIELLKAGVSKTFKRTERTVIIEGWVPRKRIREMEGALTRATGGRYHLEKLETDELAPTLSSKPGFLKPFDYLISFLSVPRSDEIDPALPFMLSFPIFYGLMISDVGYGIASFILAWYLTRITDPDGLLYNTCKIWQFSAIAAVFFGFLSNQYFGLQLNQYFTTFVGFDWFKNIPTIILACIIFGLIQVVVGLAIGAINHYKHHRMLSYARMLSIVLVISGTLAIAGGLFNQFSSTLTMVFAGIAIVSLIATMALSGVEAGEVTSLISHPLSYIRIMGFGLAGVVLAYLIDMAFTPKLSLGIPLFILYFVIFIVLHFLNMIVSIFEGAVQGARLNFIEFFTKFYKGGGVRFTPFSSKRVYTKE